MDFLQEGKKIKKHGIIGLCLLFTLFGSIVTLIFNILDGIKILSTDWNNKELNDSKTLWGIFCFVILGPIASIVFGGKVVSAYTNVNPAAAQTTTTADATVVATAEEPTTEEPTVEATTAEAK